MKNENRPPVNRRSRHSAAAPLSSLLESALSFEAAKKAEKYAAFPHWEEAVGEEIAAVAHPERIIRGKVLAVRVADAAWAQELSMQKQQILERINGLGVGAVFEDIHFLTGKPLRPPRES